MNAKNMNVQQPQLPVYGRRVYAEWNVNNELELADYKIKKENHNHQCPYCGYLNRKHKYMPKGEYSKCEECKKIFFNISRKGGGCKK